VDYPSPVATLTNSTEITEVVNYDVDIGVTVSNSASYDSVSYQWYAYNGSYYYKVKNGASATGYTFTGVTTASLKVQRDTPSGVDGLILRCEVTGTKNGYDRISNTDDVTVKFVAMPLPVITKDPVGSYITMAAGTYVLEVSATSLRGTVTYQWQSSTNNSTWTNVVNETGYSLILDTSSADAGIYYRCVVSNAAGSVNSASALVVITDATVLGAELTRGLEVEVITAAAGYTIDNVNRRLVCHLGDSFYITFEYDKGNADLAPVTYVGADWRKTSGLPDGGSSDGLEKRTLFADMAGTFEYYGYFHAEYTPTSQAITFDRMNSAELVYTVVVLPGEDTTQPASVTVALGSTEVITIPTYDQMFNNGISTNSTATLFTGQANLDYGFIRGYRLFLGIENAQGEMEYRCVASAGMYSETPTVFHYDGESLTLDPSAAGLSAGVYDAFIMMDYFPIINENDNGYFRMRYASYEGHHFPVTVTAACTHDHLTAVYTENYTDPDAPRIFYSLTCDYCGHVDDTRFYAAEQSSAGSGSDVIQQAATCTTDGIRAHKHYTGGDLDVYFIQNGSGQWIPYHTNVPAENEVIKGLIIKAGHTHVPVAAQAATCTTDGHIEHYECSVCHTCFIMDGENYIEVDVSTVTLDMFHKALTPQSASATCTEPGVKEYYYCSHCEKNFEDSEGAHEITDLATWKAGNGQTGALGHLWGPWVVIKAATDTEDGIEERTCLRDSSHKEQRSITASGYSYTTDGDGVKVFNEVVTPGENVDLTGIFAAAKGSSGKVGLSIGSLDITFDKNVVSSLGSGAVSINAKLVTENTGIEGAEAVVDVTLTGASFGDGKATVSLPFNKAVPEGKVPVVYLVDGANKTKIDSTFENGRITFEVPHFSKYAVFFEDESSSNGGGFPIWAIVLIVVVVLAAAGAGAFFVVKKKKA
jgi:hypothetical protein